MAVFFSWIQGHWSSLVGAVGIIGSLLFTAAHFREDCKNRLVTNLLAIEGRHREFWSVAQQRKDLKRIFSHESDALEQPLTSEEDIFMRRVILHFETGWRLEKVLNRGEMSLLHRDAHDFFALPLPRATWEKYKKFNNREFVRFMERALK
jgi:hypothetical protein